MYIELPEALTFLPLREIFLKIKNFSILQGFSRFSLKLGLTQLLLLLYDYLLDEKSKLNKTTTNKMDKSTQFFERGFFRM